MDSTIQDTYMKHLFLSISSGATSIASLIAGYMTQQNIAFVIASIGGLYSIYNSYLAHQRNRHNKRRDLKERAEWEAYMESLKKDDRRLNDIVCKNNGQ